MRVICGENCGSNEIIGSCNGVLRMGGMRNKDILEGRGWRRTHWTKGCADNSGVRLFV